MHLRYMAFLPRTNAPDIPLVISANWSPANIQQPVDMHRAKSSAGGNDNTALDDA
jgi:hypothetical protein